MNRFLKKDTADLIQTTEYTMIMYSAIKPSNMCTVHSMHIVPLLEFFKKLTLHNNNLRFFDG